VDTHEPGVAIITGGSQGIGAGLVTAYRDLGWSVVASAITMPPSQDQQVLAVEGDISEPGTADRIVGGALDRFGRIDTLINNAGAFMSKPFTEYTEDDYALLVGVNLTGFFRLTQRAIAEMLTGGGGLVVSITTTIVDYAHSSEPSALAVEYASRGIRVNAIAPGVIRTPMHANENYDAAARLAPMGRVGDVSDIVGGVLFLQSSPFVTGETVHIDGGQIAGH